MSNWNGNDHGGPSFPFWKVMLVAVGAILVAWALSYVFFPEGGGTP